jgi:hypothetical protein
LILAGFDGIIAGSYLIPIGGRSKSESRALMNSEVVSSVVISFTITLRSEFPLSVLKGGIKIKVRNSG